MGSRSLTLREKSRSCILAASIVIHLTLVMTDSLESAVLPRCWKSRLPFPTPVSTGSGSEGLLSGRVATPRRIVEVLGSRIPGDKSRGSRVDRLLWLNLEALNGGRSTAVTGSNVYQPTRCRECAEQGRPGARV